jgi:cyclic pyranopterin phosphate synthase
MLRTGAAAEEIAARISSIWRGRADRGAELRAATGARGVLVGIEQLRLDPHLEMHTRGG